MKTIRWGIIGPGVIAEKFASAMSVVDDSTIVAVASRSQERATNFAKKFAIPTVHPNYNALASDPAIDAVYISTLHPFHKDQALLCIKNSKAVLCEKPITMNAQELQEIIQSARKYKTFVMEALWTRFLPAIREAMSYKHEIGTINRIEAYLSSYREVSHQHRCIKYELGGGALLDLGVYLLNFARLASGEWPIESKSIAQILNKTDMQSSYLLSYKSGAIAQLSCGFNVTDSRQAFIHGSEGTIEFPTFFIGSEQAIVRSKNGERIIKKPFHKNGFEYQLEEVNNCIRNGQMESSIMPLSESLKITEQMDAFRLDWGLKYPSE